MGTSKDRQARVELSGKVIQGSEPLTRPAPIRRHVREQGRRVPMSESYGEYPGKRLRLARLAWPLRQRPAGGGRDARARRPRLSLLRRRYLRGQLTEFP